MIWNEAVAEKSIIEILKYQAGLRLKKEKIPQFRSREMTEWGQ